MKDNQQSKDRGILSNYLFCHKLISHQMGRRYLVNDLFAVIFGVGAPFAALAFPSFAIVIFEGSRPVEEKIGLVLAGALFVKLLMTLLNYFNNEQLMNYFKGRIHAVDPIRKQIIHMDFESLEKKEGQEKLRAANECVFSGNDQGFETFLGKFPNLVMNLIGFLIYSAIVFKLSPALFSFMFLTAIGFSLINLKQGDYWNRTKSIQKELMIRRKKAFQETADVRARGDLILYQMKDWLCGHLSEIRNDFETYYDNYFKIERRTQWWMHVINLLRDGVVYYLLLSRMIEGRLGVSAFVLLVGVVAGYQKWIEQLLICLQQISLNSHTVTQYRAFLAYGKLPENAPVKALAKVDAHEIRLEHVCYRYEGAEEDLIKDLTLTIKKGEKIALVGANGAGKTTLVKLMTGLYQPTSGAIYLDDIHSAQIDRKAYFKAFSVVFQEMKIYAATVAQNVSCSLSPDKDRVASSLVKAGLWDKIKSLDLAMETPMTQRFEEGGLELSGGQTQKLMLARALYQDAPILILDEPTAALDPIAESLMYETYSEFGHKKTSVFISHRLSSTRFCDRVCFLKDGQLTEIGTHEELLALGGDYAHMYQIQSQYYQDEERTYTEEVV